MGVLFDWPPILWAARIVVLSVLAGAFAVIAAVLFGLLRPSSLRAIASGGLPALRALRGTFRVLGQALEVDAELESRRDIQLLALENEIVHLKKTTARHERLLGRLLEREEDTGS